MALYKFKSYNTPKNKEYFKDIIENKRLYAANFEELNDPMEGVYMSCGLSEQDINLIRDEKMHHRIVSLTRHNTDGFMWVFYADECKGCCIEVEPITTDTSWRAIPIKYNADLRTIQNDVSINPLSVVHELLTCKLERWRYEQEIRYMNDMIVDNNEEDHYMPVRIVRVYLGHKIGEKEEQEIRDLINHENETNSNKIDIVKFDRKDYTWNVESTTNDNNRTIEII